MKHTLIITIGIGIIIGIVFIKQSNKAVIVETKPSLGLQDGQAFNGLVREQNQSGNLDQIKSTGGVLGSVVITGAAAGTFELYDASTTNASLRVPQATSSLRLLASFPTNAAVGTYVFNTAFTYGLVSQFIGTMPTTTITNR